MPKTAGKDEVLALAREVESVKRHLEGKNVVREIFVPGRIVSFVVK